MGGTVEEAYLAYILRDHDWEKLRLKKDTVLKAQRKLTEGTGQVLLRCRLLTATEHGGTDPPSLAPN